MSPARQAPLDVEDTAGRIRTAALDLFARQGYAATGIREIATTAGVTSAALYHYMGTKEDLLARLAIDANERLLSIARDAVALTTRPEESLVALVRVHVIAHVLHRREALVVDNELGHLGEQHRRKVIAVRDTYEDLWRDTLYKGSSASVFTVVDLRTTRLALLEMCTGVAHWFDPQGGLTPIGIAGQFADLALGCVRARRGRTWLSRMHVGGPTDEEIYELVLLGTDDKMRARADADHA